MLYMLGNNDYEQTEVLRGTWSSLPTPSKCDFFLFLLFFFGTGFLCVTVLFVLELALLDQADIKLREIHLSLPPECSRVACATTAKLIFLIVKQYSVL